MDISNKPLPPKKMTDSNGKIIDPTAEESAARRRMQTLRKNNEPIEEMDLILEDQTNQGQTSDPQENTANRTPAGERTPPTCPTPPNTGNTTLLQQKTHNKKIIQEFDLFQPLNEEPKKASGKPCHPTPKFNSAKKCL